MKRGQEFEQRMGFRDPLDDDYHPPAAPAPAVSRTAITRAPQKEFVEKYPSSGTMSVAPTQGVSRKKDPARPRTRSPLEQQGHTMARRRQRWEENEGAERMQGVEGNPELGPHFQGLKTAQIYQAKEWAKTQEPGPTMYDRQLPGMEDPHAAPEFPRWEDLDEKQRRSVEQRVKAKTGATFESMKRSIGSQVDQAFMRMERHGADKPHAADFYTSGEPAQVIQRTAQDFGVPAGLVAAMHADNSPNTPFESKGRYPQDEMARAALEHVQSGEAPHTAKRPKGAQGLTNNYLKSAQRADQVLNEGRPLGETRVSPGGYGEGKSSGLGPKTAAYMNSWLPSQPDQFVSDVHSGGGGALPHLSAAKPIKRDALGNPVRKPEHRGDPTPDEDLPDSYFVRDKSQRERGLETAGVHSMIDAAARAAFAERGLNRLRQAQAAQWGEERIQRGLQHESKAYPPKETPINPAQMRLFD